jgi:hypothetical protein
MALLDRNASATQCHIHADDKSANQTNLVYSPVGRYARCVSRVGAIVKMMRPMLKENLILPLHGLRGLAAISVVIAHSRDLLALPVDNLSGSVGVMLFSR